MEIVSHWFKVIRTAGIMSNCSSHPPPSLLRTEQTFGMTPGTLYSMIQHENMETLRKVNTEFQRATKGIKRLPRTLECMCDLKKMDFAGLEHQTASGCDKHFPLLSGTVITHREGTGDSMKRLPSAFFRQLEVAKFQSTENNLKKEHLDTI